MGIVEYLGLAGGFDAQGEVRRLRRDVAALQAQVDALSAAVNVDVSRVEPPLPVSENVMRLLGQGRHIEAVKAHREETGLGLAAAKAEVDEARRRLG